MSLLCGLALYTFKKSFSKRIWKIMRACLSIHNFKMIFSPSLNLNFLPAEAFKIQNWNKLRNELLQTRYVKSQKPCADHGLRTPNEDIKDIWKIGLMWQTKYALVVPKNWEMGLNFQWSVVKIDMGSTQSYQKIPSWLLCAVLMIGGVGWALVDQIVKVAHQPLHSSIRVTWEFSSNCGSTSPLIDNFWTENTISGFTLIHTGWNPIFLS